MIPNFRAYDGGSLNRMYQPDEVMVCGGDIWIIDEDVVAGEWIVNNDIHLMQSTGLFDKKGVEIFEGDVISTYTDNLVIKRDNLLGFYVEYVEVDEKRNYFAETVDIEYLDLFAKDFGVAVEVLGNIYENAEMVCEVK
nr:MAG TPA: YopX protein [Bacteriophage sp.]